MYIDDEGDDDIQLADEASGLGPLKQGKKIIDELHLLFQTGMRAAFCLCDSLLKLSLMFWFIVSALGVEDEEEEEEEEEEEVDEYDDNPAPVEAAKKAKDAGTTATTTTTNNGGSSNNNKNITAPLTRCKIDTQPAAGKR